ncbi:MAG: hypothetical protein M3680_19180, partial [Myxococcota bacterium]|nr:hypothetical protein [Myxococcota bacterium]
MTTSAAVRPIAWRLVGLITCASALGCGRKAAVDPGPDLQVVGESMRVRLEDPVPRRSPWFDGERVTLVAARGETLGIQVLHRGPGAASLVVPDATVRGFDVEAFAVHRPSTALFGGSHGKGTYADGLTPNPTPSTNPAYFEIAIDAAASPGVRSGELVVGDRRVPVQLTITPVVLPPLPRTVWAYADPRELVWANGGTGDPAREVASPDERACIELFRTAGVLLSPDLQLAWWEARKPLLDGFPYIPVMISTDPVKAAAEVRGWIAATAGTGQVPFTIPIDEPRTPERRREVRALADAVRAAGGGPGRFHYAVTDAPHADYGDAIDLYISWRAAHLAGDRVQRWTYNGAPPYAGAVVLDAETPGTRTWGWVAWRWNIPVWYVWDALYWHDRHNRKGKPLPGRTLDPRVDPVSFDDGEDQGNFDGVLALPATGAPGGCRPTLRLAALRRGNQDRQLLERAAACAPDAT